LQPLAQWLEGDGNDRGREDREQQVATTRGVDQRTDARHDGDVDGGYHHRHRPVDNGAVDDDVDVVEAVLKDRDPGSDWNRDQRGDQDRCRGLAQDARGFVGVARGREEVASRARSDPRSDDAARIDEPLELLALLAS